MKAFRGRMLRLRARVRAVAARSRAGVEVAPDAWVGRRLRLLIGRDSASALRLRAGASVGEDVSLLLRGGEITVGEGAAVEDGVILEAAGGSIEVGPRARVRRGAVLRSGGGRIDIGAGADVGELAVMLGSAEAAVRVGDGAVVGVKATLMPGAQVGRGARVPAGTVLSPAQAPRTAPRPARPARRRSGPAARSR